MKPRTSLGVALIAIFTGAVAYTTMLNIKQKDDDARPQTTVTVLAPQEPTRGTGAYEDYSKYWLSTAKGPILLYFHGDTYQQCQKLDEQIDEAGVPDGVTILKVDYVNNLELRQKYGVTDPGTFVKVDNRGTLIQMYSAYNDPNFETVKANLLAI